MCNGRINVIASRVPSLVEAAARTFSLGEAARLCALFEGAGFRDVQTTTEAHRFVRRSFEAFSDRSSGAEGPAGKRT